MDRRVAQGRLQASRDDRASPPNSVAPTGVSRAVVTPASVGIGLGLVVIALLVYTATHPFRYYDHF